MAPEEIVAYVIDHWTYFSIRLLGMSLDSDENNYIHSDE